MEIVGYIAALFIGVSLGLIGGGGSILTVPLLVYLFGIDPLLATSYSLFIVGSTSLVGAYTNFKKGLVDFRTALLFGISSIVTVFAIRKLVIPLLPDVLHLGIADIETSTFTMLLFAVLMLFASASMIRSNPVSPEGVQNRKAIAVLLLYGVGIGLVTGFLGAGGGFILIPALVLLLKLPMKKAVGTSLVIIALNSLFGFVADAGHFKLDWKLLAIISAIAMSGILVGSLLAKKIEGQRLKIYFGWFVMAMGIYIIVKEFFL